MADEHAPGSSDFDRRGVTAQRGPSSARGSRYGIVVARFNSAITGALYDAAVDVLLDAGAAPHHIESVQVAGCVEVPLAARELAEHHSVAAVVALGCVIRGDTAHFDYVCNMVTDGCLAVQMSLGVPVGFGVLTCETADQAVARAQVGGGHNVGADAARAALELSGLLRQVRGS
jgi:6,7-dimethyl-8-ribityllumazine synthase